MVPRGAPKADLAALEDLLLRIGALADDHPEIAELDSTPSSPAPTAPPSSTSACGSNSQPHPYHSAPADDGREAENPQAR